ncbi:IscS subfamily cysteine desulfurase [Rossellomorea vietnamensis]|uniref:IscS subfamily cysteine desulfurase n=1 Tax=Rossellomorea vietnamensis TaxID=218284 RepID=UPI001E51D6FB|nr:IscS subfamily cysteine desulfurase [Rossellomorea vietnamensis]MCC5801416.1 IscS subfamily cysteine desulfurase [Rossellomorea vietnamensis]
MNYFDYAATTPVDAESLRVFRTVSEEFWGNPSSLHDIGGKAEQLLSRCREKLAALLGVPSKGIHFTSGGTEGNHLALVTLALSRQKKGKHIIIGGGEHSSLHSSAGYLQDLGFSVTKVPLDSKGLIDIDRLTASISDQTTVVSIGHVNGEIGTIQPLYAIKDLLRSRDVLFHSDMVQSFGKIDLSEFTSLVDSFTFSSHKIYGPKGVGALYINPALDISPMIPGQTHEDGFRGGTVNLPGIAGFVTAAEHCFQSMKTDHFLDLRFHFLTQLTRKLPGLFTLYEGPLHAQLPHVIGLGIHGIEGQWLMLECNRHGMCISTGSACSAGSQDMSKTLQSMGVSQRAGKEFIRISFGRDTRTEQAVALAHLLSDIHAAHTSALT